MTSRILDNLWCLTSLWQPRLTCCCHKNIEYLSWSWHHLWTNPLTNQPFQLSNFQHRYVKIQIVYCYRKASMILIKNHLEDSKFEKEKISWKDWTYLGNLGAIRSKLDEIKDKKRLGSKLGEQAKSYYYYSYWKISLILLLTQCFLFFNDIDVYSTKIPCLKLS